MDAAEVLELVARGEDTQLQFKRDLNNPDQTAAEIAAFANTKGGKLLIGVDDAKHTIIGLSSQDVKRINQLVSNASSQCVHEPVYPSSQVVEVDGKLLIVIEVAESEGKPHFDNNGAVWVKTVGDKRRVTAREELRRLFQEVDALHADSLAVKGTTEADLNTDEFAAYYERQYKRSFRDENIDLRQILNNLNLAHGNELNLAGLLLFGKEPQRFRPMFVIKAVSFVGNDAAGTKYVDSEDVVGTLPGLFQGALAFLKRNLRQIQSGDSFNSPAVPEIDPIVLEESSVNALIHRNYFINAPWKLFVFANRIEIISPGSLPNNLTVEHALNGNAIARNPILLSFCAKGLLPYRGIGTGLQRIRAHAPKTQFFNEPDMNRFRVVVPRPAS